MYTLFKKRASYLKGAGAKKGIAPGDEDDAKGTAGAARSLANASGGGAMNAGLEDDKRAGSSAVNALRHGVPGFGKAAGFSPGDDLDEHAGNENLLRGGVKDYATTGGGSDSFSAGHGSHAALAEHHQKLADFHRGKANPTEGSDPFGNDAADDTEHGGHDGFGDEGFTSAKTGGAAKPGHEAHGGDPGKDDQHDAGASSRESLEEETPEEESMETPEVEALEDVHKHTPNSRTPGEAKDKEMFSLPEEEDLESSDTGAGYDKSKGGLLRNSKGKDDEEEGPAEGSENKKEKTRNEKLSPISRFNSMRKGGR